MCGWFPGQNVQRLCVITHETVILVEVFGGFPHLSTHILAHAGLFRSHWDQAPRRLGLFAGTVIRCGSNRKHRPVCFVSHPYWKKSCQRFASYVASLAGHVMGCSRVHGISKGALPSPFASSCLNFKHAAWCMCSMCRLLFPLDGVSEEEPLSVKVFQTQQLSKAKQFLGQVGSAARTMPGWHWCTRLINQRVVQAAPSG